MLGRLQDWIWWRGLKRRVAERGWTIIHLGGDGRDVVWAYSVGFWEFAGAPEVIVFGHDEVWSNGLISEALRQIQGGLVLQDMMPWSIEGFEGTWRRVDRMHTDYEEWFTCARRYRRERTGNQDFEAFQLFVPDETGKYPWDDGFDEGWRHLSARTLSPNVDIRARRIAVRGLV